MAEREYTADEWPEASPEQRHGMTHLRHAFRSRPHFVAYWVDELPAAAPWIARNIFGLPLLTWTVRTPEQRARAARNADQMIFEGFLPGNLMRSAPTLNSPARCTIFEALATMRDG